MSPSYRFPLWVDNSAVSLQQGLLDHSTIADATTNTPQTSQLSSKDVLPDWCVTMIHKTWHLWAIFFPYSWNCIEIWDGLRCDFLSLQPSTHIYRIKHTKKWNGNEYVDPTLWYKFDQMWIQEVLCWLHPIPFIKHDQEQSLRQCQCISSQNSHRQQLGKYALAYNMMQGDQVRIRGLGRIISEGIN